MLKGIAICLVLLMVLGITTTAHARVAAGSSKLEKGVVGLVTAPLEVPKQIYNTSKESNALVGITVGTLKGAVNLVTKGLAGVFNIVTCPFPRPVMEGDVFPAPAEETEAVK